MDIRDSQRIKQIRDNTEKMADAFTRIADALERLTEPSDSEKPNNCEDEPQKKEVEWVYNKRERLWYPYSNDELLFKDEPQVRSNLEPFRVDKPRTIPLYPMKRGEE